MLLIQNFTRNPILITKFAGWLLDNPNECLNQYIIPNLEQWKIKKNNKQILVIVYNW